MSNNRIQEIRELAEWAARKEYSGIMVPTDPLNVLLSEYDRLREILGFYADEENYTVKVKATEWEPYIAIDRDGGKRARAALSHLKGEKPSE